MNINIEKMFDGSQGEVTTRVNSDGSIHYTVYLKGHDRNSDDKGCRFSADKYPDGHWENAHSTHQDDGKHFNYNVR